MCGGSPEPQSLPQILSHRTDSLASIFRGGGGMSMKAM
jgi:hypothetical protein